ncbi:MAG: nucleotidyl transferase AbiEii/AbiGii toxin family protein [Oligoflexia bacterium]|nr:nucleotidyl transferase AbiEii/AbiGii toxin family protein [Oligoflexia bacterium]
MKSIPANTPEFARSFAEYSDCYVIIGGTAVLAYIEDRGQSARTTTDLDIVILDTSEEKRSKDFLEHFCKYIEDNKYKCDELKDEKSQSYRFTEPENKLAPTQIEISTRRQEGLPLKQKAQRIESFEMSAIACEGYFVDLINAHRASVEIETGLPLPVPKLPVLILLKAFAYLNLKDSKNSTDKEKAKKHIIDIIRIARVLKEEDKISADQQSYGHLLKVFEMKDALFVEQRLKSCGWPKGTLAQKIVDVINAVIEVS